MTADTACSWLDFRSAGIFDKLHITARGFKSRALKRFCERGENRQIRAEHRQIVRDVLVRLDAAAKPEDMNLPGFRLRRLRGDYAGYWAVTVRANWRVIFRLEEATQATSTIWNTIERR